MKLVIGTHEHQLTKYDACFLGGCVLMIGGLWYAFNVGVVVALTGAGMASVPFLRSLFRFEPPPTEPAP